MCSRNHFLQPRPSATGPGGTPSALAGELGFLSPRSSGREEDPSVWGGPYRPQPFREGVPRTPEPSWSWLFLSRCRCQPLHSEQQDSLPSLHLLATARDPGLPNTGPTRPARRVSSLSESSGLQQPPVVAGHLGWVTSALTNGRTRGRWPQSWGEELKGHPNFRARRIHFRAPGWWPCPRAAASVTWVEQGSWPCFLPCASQPRSTTIPRQTVRVPSGAHQCITLFSLDTERSCWVALPQRGPVCATCPWAYWLPHSPDPLFLGEDPVSDVLKGKKRWFFFSLFLDDRFCLNLHSCTRR